VLSVEEEEEGKKKRRKDSAERGVKRKRSNDGLTHLER
jgi:hypothetical protein